MERVRMSTGKNRERNRRKKENHSGRKCVFALTLGCMGILGLIAGCGYGRLREGETAGETVTKLRVVHSSGDVRWTGSMEWVAEEFMWEHPDIQVTLAAPADVTGQSFTDRLKILIAEDEFYDVVELREDVRFSETGYLAPLPDSVVSLVKGAAREEACYAVPRYTTTLGIIYNLEIFEELGLTRPESYEDFLDICGKIRQEGMSPVAVGGRDIWHMGFWGNYLYQNYILDSGKENCWNQEQVLEMLEDFRTLNRKGYIESRFANMTDSQAVYELSSGNAAMVYSGPWIIDQVMGLNPQMELGFFYLPGKDGRIWAAVDCSATWGISKACAEDEARFQAAADFLEFFYSEGIYEYVLAQMNAEPVTVREITDNKTKAQQMVREAKQEKMVPCDKFVGDRDTPDGFRNFYDQSLQETLWGVTALEDIARELEERWNGRGQ